MDTRAARTFTSALVLVLLCVAAGLRTESRINAAAAYYAEALKTSAFAGNAIIQGREIIFKDGHILTEEQPVSDRVKFRALRTMYGARLAARKPIFGLAGTDVDELKKQIDALAAVQKEVANEQDSAAERENILTHLYPIDFLRSLSTTESARRAFIQFPTEPTMRTYHRSLQRTIHAYQKDLDSFSKGFEISAPDSFPLVLLQGTITKESMREAIEAAGKRIIEVSERSTLRAQCLSGVIAICDTNDLDLVRIPVPPPSASPDSRRSLANEAVKILEEAHPSGTDFLTKMSLIALNGSTCAQGFPGPHYFLFTNPSPGSERAIESLIFVGDLLSYPQNDARPRETAFAFLSPTTYYLCPSVGVDMSRAKAVRQAIQLKEPDQDLSYSSGAQLDERDAISYAYSLIESADTAADGSELLLAFADHGAGIELLVRDVVAQQRAVAREAKNGDKTDISAGWNFLVRSAFVPLFLLEHRTMAPEIQIYSLDHNDASIDHVLRWSELKRTMPREEIVRDVRTFLEAHRDEISG